MLHAGKICAKRSASGLGSLEIKLLYQDDDGDHQRMCEHHSERAKGNSKDDDRDESEGSLALPCGGAGLEISQGERSEA